VAEIARDQHVTARGHRVTAGGADGSEHWQLNPVAECADIVAWRARHSVGGQRWRDATFHALMWRGMLQNWNAGRAHARLAGSSKQSWRGVVAKGAWFAARQCSF